MVVGIIPNMDWSNYCYNSDNRLSVTLRKEKNMGHLIKVKSFDKVNCKWVYAYINPEKIIMLSIIEDEHDGDIYVLFIRYCYKIIRK